MADKLYLSESESLEIVNFTNIGTEDFECGWGGHKEVFPAGKTVPLPMFKAVAFCKHLVDALLMKEGKDYGSDLFRKPLEDKIMGRVTVATEVVEKAEEFADAKKEEEFSDVVEKTAAEIKAEKKAAKEAEKVAKAEAKAAAKAAKEAAKEA